MYQEQLLQLRNIYNNVPTEKEENLKVKVVIPFLEMLGYNEKWFDYESNINVKGSEIDILIRIDNNENHLFFC